jgi:hypothetical protein
MYPERFLKEPTRKTPWVILEPGRIFILGRSIPENPGEFYRPIFEWISEYKLEYDEKTIIGFGFEYINTSSTKWVHAILKEIAEIKDLSLNVKVYWYFEQGDEDMSDLGFILRSLVYCPFIVVEIDKMSREKYDQLMSMQF